MIDDVSIYDNDDDDYYHHHLNICDDDDHRNFGLRLCILHFSTLEQHQVRSIVILILKNFGIK